MPTTQEVARVARTRDAEWFIDELQGVSPGNLRALWLPRPHDTTSTSSPNTSARTWTHSTTIAARVSYQGNGVLVSFNGTDQYAGTPDTADLSIIEPAGMSIVSLVNVTNTAGERPIITKWGTTSDVYEYQLGILAGDTLRFIAHDQSAGVNCNRTSNAAITQGSVVLLGVSYDGSGGATAMNGAALYQNAAVIASTATNNASYVAMENTACSMQVAAVDDAAAVFTGSMGFAAIYAANLSAAQHAAIADISRAYYEVKL